MEEDLPVLGCDISTVDVLAVYNGSLGLARLVDIIVRNHFAQIKRLLLEYNFMNGLKQCRFTLLC